MIGKVTRGSNTGGLLRYLYGPGKANEHRNPHLVASWLGDDPRVLETLEPGRDRRPFAQLAARLDLPLQLLPDRPDKHVWQCSMRLAGEDRQLSDAEWALVAREVVERTGFAPAKDPGGCRWVAVRHADDHIHIVVSLARQDGDPVRVFRDWPKVHAAARAVEQRFGLVTVESPDRSAAVTPTRGEEEKARRTRVKEAPRAWLAREVRVVAAGTTSRQEFEEELLRRGGVVIKWRESTQTPGEKTGYSVGRVDDLDRAGEQIWFSGSKLSPDLSLPKLDARWREGSTGRSSDRDHLLAEVNARFQLAARGPVDAGMVLAAAETASVLGDLMDAGASGELTQAATELARAARSSGGVRPVPPLVHDLRTAASSLYQLGRLATGDMREALLIVAHLMRIADALSRRSGSTVGRGSSAGKALQHLQRHCGPVQTEQVEQIRRALPERWAQRVLQDPALPALAAQLRDLTVGGVDTVPALRSAFHAREIESAESVTAVLHYRLARSAPRPPTRPDATTTNRPTWNHQSSYARRR